MTILCSLQVYPSAFSPIFKQWYQFTSPLNDLIIPAGQRQEAKWNLAYSSNKAIEIRAWLMAVQMGPADWNGTRAV